MIRPSPAEVEALIAALTDYAGPYAAEAARNGETPHVTLQAAAMLRRLSEQGVPPREPTGPVWGAMLDAAHCGEKYGFAGIWYAMYDAWLQHERSMRRAAPSPASEPRVEPDIADAMRPDPMPVTPCAAPSAGAEDGPVLKTEWQQLQAQNKALSQRVAELERERDHYRTISGDLLQADHAAEGAKLKAESALSAALQAKRENETLHEAIVAQMQAEYRALSSQNVAALERERALQQDAERYRCVRNLMRLGQHGEWVAIIGDEHNLESLKLAFDQHIDAARGGEVAK